MKLITRNYKLEKKIKIKTELNLKGVRFYKSINKYGARIRKNYKFIVLGFYDTPEEALKAYEEAKIKYYGTFLDKCKVTNG